MRRAYPAYLLTEQSESVIIKNKKIEYEKTIRIWK